MSDSVHPLAPSPYYEVWDYYCQHSGSASAMALAKLLLNLQHGGFPLRECFQGLDTPRRDLALRVVRHFALHGPEPALFEIGTLFLEKEPQLKAVVEATERARQAVRDAERR